MQKVTINFDNLDAAKYFMDWLCGSGEQAYWDAMACQDEEDNVMVDKIEYDFKKFVITAKSQLPLTRESAMVSFTILAREARFGLSKRTNDKMQIVLVT